MKARIFVAALALTLAGALPLRAERPDASGDHAVSRGGGSSGGHSSSGATARQPSSSGGGSSYSGDSGRRERAQSGSLAERRHPRAGSGSGRRHGGGYWHSRPYYYSPGYYGYYDWWYGPGWYSWGYYPGYSWRYRHSYDYDDDGSLRLQVTPNKARVYVDGYYAGVVDDFDGLFQRLHLPPGRHELSFKLEGYKTHRLRLYVPADQTLKIRYDLVPGGGEEAVDESLDRPGMEWAERDRRERDSWRERDRDRERRRARGEDARRDDDEDVADKPGDASATLDLDVTPEQAAVYVDGSFRGTGQDIESLSLPPGRHRVEVVAPGYRTFDREVDVKAGETEELNVELARP